MGKALGYIIWAIFDRAASGFNVIAHFAKEGECRIAQYTLNKRKQDVLSRLEQLPPKIRDEAERVISKACAAMDEKYTNFV